MTDTSWGTPPMISPNNRGSKSHRQVLCIVATLLKGCFSPDEDLALRGMEEAWGYHQNKGIKHRQMGMGQNLLLSYLRE